LVRLACASTALAQDKAEGLRQATLAMLGNKRLAHPYYWAPFILVGEPK
jgi:CHAT domain-containing protein